MADADETRMQAGDDPKDFTVTQVNDYLNTLTGTDDPEHQRVLAAEADGEKRKGILGEPTEPGQEEGDQAPLTTKGASFEDAAKDATPDPKGYWGQSPEAERTGRRDKGLSQRNPAVMNQGGQVPDPSPHVDDSEAIAALKDDEPDER